MKQFFTTTKGGFRLVALLEGLTLLILIFIGMPLKYMMDKHGVVDVVGPIHGGLFILYSVIAIYFATTKKWKLLKTAKVLLASFIPFGTFYIDHKILRKI